MAQRKNPAPVTDDNLPAGWGDADQLDGFERTDKHDLVGVPLRITGVTNGLNNRGVEIMYLDGERADGTTFTITDSSGQGIKGQVLDYLDTKGVTVEEDKVVAVSIVAPKGLRLSVYDPTDKDGNPVIGRDGKPLKDVKTFYLTTSGRRA